MKGQSSIRPGDFYMRKVESNNSYIKLRKNIQEKEVGHNEGVDIVYEYDEVEVVVANRTNLSEYITEYFDELFAMGLEKANEFPEPTLEERLQALEVMELERLLGGV